MKTHYALFGVLFLLLCISLQSAAQTPEKDTRKRGETPRRVDKSIPDNNPESGQQPAFDKYSFQHLPAEIESLLSKAQTSINTQPAQSLNFAEKALRLAKKQKHRPAEYCAYQLLGDAYESLNNSTRASAQYSLQVASALRIGRPEMILTAKKNLARSLIQRQQLDSAQIIISDAANRAATAGLRSLDPELAMLQGDISFQQGAFSEAAPHYRSAARIYIDANDSTGYYNAIMGAAKSFNLSEQYEEALLDYKKCLEFPKLLKDTTESVRLYNNIAGVYNKLGKYDLSITNFQTAIKFATELGEPYLIAVARMGLGVALYNLEYNDRAVEEYIESLTLAKEVQDEQKQEILTAFIYMNLGAAFSRLREYGKSMQYYLKEEEIREKLGDVNNLPITYYSIAEMLLNKQDYPAAENYYRKALHLSQELNNQESVGIILGGMSRLALRRNQKHRSLEYAKQSLELLRPTGAMLLIAQQHDDLGAVYDSLGRYATAKQHFLEEMRIGNSINAKRVVSQAAHGLSHTYAYMGRYDSAFYYSDMHTEIRDSILTGNMAMQAKATEALYQADKNAREAAIAKLNLEHEREARWESLRYAAIAFLLVFSAAVIAFIGYRGKKRAHERLQATQEQLLVQEKLASLGQLTAGIAHEIQNPLNFVNNFSEMTRDLATEVLHLVSGDGDRALEDKRDQIEALLDDINSNSLHVYEHGKRASAIVNQMLQHARTDSGEKADIDLNKILAEMTDLAYHGMRARHKGMVINVEREFSRDELVVHAGAQELGRVVVNILNNAFDALIDRHESNPGFVPEVIVSTHRHGGHAEVRIRDNGPGIPDAIRDKIFQPFYTTKPSGKGTGLGLSLCHDIITKKYGGKLDVNSNPGEFTEFKICLPLKKS